MLLERSDELGWLEDAVAALAGGDGGVLAIEGPAGAGKTALLDHAAARARATGLAVASAAATRLERDAEGALLGLLARDDGELPARLAVAVRRAGPAAPLVVCADDVHWADATSLRALAALARRSATDGTLLVVTLRPGAEAADGEALAALCRAAQRRVLEPLSAAATAAVVRARLPGAGDAFCAAAHDLTAGNPLLATALADAAVADHLSGGDAEREALAASAAWLARPVGDQLDRLGARAAALARSLAVVGLRAGLGVAAAIAGLDEAETASALDALVAAGIVTGSRPPRLRPPLVDRAIRAGFGPGTAGRLHAEAAQRLAARGDHAGAAEHLLQTEPRADAAAAASLHLAAGEPGCAPERAAVLLRRALDEPPPRGAARGAILRDLGLVELGLGRVTAVRHLQDAHAELPGDRAAALGLARAHLDRGDADAAAGVLAGVLAALAPAEDDLRWRLEAELAAVGLMHPERWRAAEARLDALRPPARGLGPGARQLHAVVAFCGYRRGEPVERVRAHAHAALVDDRADGALLAAFAPLTMLLTALAACDELALARAIAAAGQAAAAERGDRVAATVMGWYGARCAFAAGDLDGALAAATTWHDGVHAPWVLPVARSQEALTWVARGEPDRAAAAVAAVDDDALEGQLAHECVLRARGMVRLAGGDAPGAARAFQAGRDIMDRFGITNPAGCHHGGGAALALAATGRQDAARELAGDELERAAGFGAAGTVGRARWIAARLDGDAVGLRAACAELREAGAEGALARALTDLGATLGRGPEARAALREALDLADRHGAARVAARARSALVAAGGRPRRARLSGAGALTAAERRAADLAASGLTNAEIAAALFVSVKTVEGHLRGAYRKLGITGRSELGDALDRD